MLSTQCRYVGNLAVVRLLIYDILGAATPLQWKTWSYIYDQSYMPNYTAKLLIWPIIWPKTNMTDTTNHMTNSSCIWPIIWPPTKKLNTTNYMTNVSSTSEYDQLYDQLWLPTWIRPMTWPMFVVNTNTTNYMTNFTINLWSIWPAYDQYTFR